MTEPVSTAAAEPTLGSSISRLAGVIGSQRYPAGDRAALRRWAPGQPLPLAFYRLWLRHLGTESPPESQAEVWMTLAWGLATMGPSAHEPRRSFGLALAKAGFSEGRLERLLSAPDDVRKELFMDAVRILGARHERFNWLDGALFLLAADSDKRESVHRRIAHAYYRHLPSGSEAKE